MLDKDTFVKYMNEIIKQYDAIEELYESIDKVFGVTGEGLIANIASVSLPIKILVDAMNDTDEWIEYYIYEGDCGRSTGKVFIDDKEIKLEMPEDLWELLTKDEVI